MRCQRIHQAFLSSPACPRQRDRSSNPSGSIGRKFKIGKDKDKTEKQDSKLNRKLTSDKLDVKNSKKNTSFNLGKKGGNVKRLYSPATLPRLLISRLGLQALQ